MPSKGTAPTTQKSVRSEVRAWIRAALDGEDAIELPFLTEQACTHFAKQPKVVERYFQENFRQMVYSEAQSVVATTRTATSTHIQLGDELVTREELTKRAKKSRWSSWMEHVGERHIRLPKMTRDDLLKAAGERRQRASIDISRAMLMERLAEQLEDGETVEDRYTDEDIDRILNEITEEATDE